MKKTAGLFTGKSFTPDEMKHAQEKDQVYERFDEFLQRILSHPNLEVVSTSSEVDDQFQVLELMKTYQLAPRDAYHLLTAQTHGAEYIATFDSDFDQVFQSGEIKKFTGG